MGAKGIAVRSGKDSSRRIAKLHEQLHRLTQFRLMTLYRRQEALRASERELVLHLDSSVAAEHADAGAIHRRLRATAAELSAVNTEIAHQARLLAEQGMRLKRAEWVAEQRAEEWRSQEERRTLAEIVQLATTRRDASLP